MVLLALALTAALFFIAPSAAIVEADTQAYLDFAPVRSAGYPAFLYMVGASAAPLVQMFAFGLASLALSLAVARLTGQRWLAAVCLVALFANPETNKFHWTLLSESLFISLNVAMLAASMMFIVGRRLHWAVVAGVFAGLAVATRPSALPLILAVVVTLLLLKPFKLKPALAAFAAAALVIAAERAASVTIHGPSLTSLSGRHLFAKAALIEAPVSRRNGFGPVENRLADAIERDYQPVRDLLREASGTAAAAPLLSYYEVCLQWSCRARLGLNDAPKTEGALKAVALDRIQKNPAGYLALTWQEYRSLWAFGSRNHPAYSASFDRFVASKGALPFSDLIRNSLAPVEPRSLVRLARPLFIALGWLLVLAMIVSAWYSRRSSIASAALLASLSAQGCIVFTALTAVGYSRYLMALWPNIAIALILSGWFVIRLVASESKPRVSSSALIGATPLTFRSGSLEPAKGFLQ